MNKQDARALARASSDITALTQAERVMTIETLRRAIEVIRGNGRRAHGR